MYVCFITKNVVNRNNNINNNINNHNIVMVATISIIIMTLVTTMPLLAERVLLTEVINKSNDDIKHKNNSYDHLDSFHKITMCLFF